MSDKTPDTCHPDLTRAENWWVDALTELAVRYCEAFSYSPAHSAAMIRSLLANAAIGALNEDVDEEAFVKVARWAYAFALEQTRVVEAEDGN